MEGVSFQQGSRDPSHSLQRLKVNRASFTRPPWFKSHAACARPRALHGCLQVGFFCFGFFFALFATGQTCWSGGISPRFHLQRAGGSHTRNSSSRLTTTVCFSLFINEIGKFPPSGPENHNSHSTSEVRPVLRSGDISVGRAAISKNWSRTWF